MAQLIGKPFMPWQAQIANVAGELLPSGIPAYREVRVSVPRQSGKTSLILVVEVDRSMYWGPRQRTLYAAQDRNNSRAKWEEQGEMLNDTPVARLYTTRRQTGLERWVFKATGSTVGITASGESSGHGQTLDLGVVDEAFAQKDERLVQAFRPAMMTRPAAQLWVVSTMGTDESVFFHDRVDDGRARVEADSRQGVCYFEWSSPDEEDPDDPATWWRCMPALGRTVTQDTIQVDHDSMEPGEFARAYLNRRAAGGAAVIDPLKWAACRESSSSAEGLVCFAIDVTPERTYASIGVAGWRKDGRRHVELIDHRAGTDWVVERLRDLTQRWPALAVQIDPASPAGSMLIDIAAAGVPTETVSTREYAQACGDFYDAVDGRELAHLEQPLLNAAVAAARKRPLGDAWAWARKVGGDISPLCAITLAHWGLVKAGTGSPQIL